MKSLRAASLLLLPPALMLLAGCHKPSSSPPTATAGTAKPHITLGLQMSPAMALVMVAKDKGCFDDAGVDVELKGFTAGKFALQAFLGGSLDFAVAGEVPITLATLHGSHPVVFTQVVSGTINEVRVVARRDGASADASTYFHAKKRRLATSIGGGPEFYTYNFLKKYRVGKDQVSIISQKPGDMPAALAGGSVDAIAIFDPFAFISEQKLGPQGMTFSDTTLYSELYVLVGNPQDATQKKAAVDGLLQGLVKAQALIQQDPEGCKQIVMKYTKLDKTVIDGIWKNFTFAPALNKSLVDDMTAEAAWAKEKGDVAPAMPTPDFRHAVINEQPLKAADPGAVQLP